MNIVLIETSGNQRYIFATNKLRENVGASESTYRIGTKYVLAAAGRPYDYENDKNGNKLRELLLNEEAIETNPDENVVEIIIATSGKALLLTRTDTKAKEIVRKVTTDALREIPGLTVLGAICEIQDNLTDIHKAVGEVHRRLEEIRYKIPATQRRFQRLPFIEPCATSGLPAQAERKFEPEAKLYSKISIVKADSKKQGYERIQKVLSGFSLIKPEEIEKCDWVANIHADGNGLGQIFLRFDEHLGFGKNGDGNFYDTKAAREYIKKYRKFSIALDICTVEATKFALGNMKEKLDEKTKETFKEKLPFVPLILGGDDLTVLCDGKYAIKFTTDFLEQFEKETKRADIQDGIIREIANKAFGKDYLGICAGVAIVKPHYPFHSAYTIAESLLRSAKQVKIKVTHEHKGEQIPTSCSALDYHVHYDSSGSDLDVVREKLKVDGGNTLLYKKPYVVTEDIANGWAKIRMFSDLQEKIEVMQTEDEDTKISNSYLHEIRESLFYGQAEANAEIRLIERHCKKPAGRYQNFKKVLEKDNSLFTNEGEKNITGFLDALDLIEFWQKEGDTQPATKGGKK